MRCRCASCWPAWTLSGSSGPRCGGCDEEVARVGDCRENRVPVAVREKEVVLDILEKADPVRYADLLGETAGIR